MRIGPRTGEHDSYVHHYWHREIDGRLHFFLFSRSLSAGQFMACLVERREADGSWTTVRESLAS